MKLRKLSLTNFRGIQQADIAFSDSPTVIVGVNGAGKTTLLDALAITLSQVTSRVYESAQKARSFSQDDIFIFSDYARAVVDLELEQQTVNFALALNKRAGKHPEERSSYFGSLNSVALPLADKNKNFRESDDIKISLPLAIYYDVHRAVMDIPLRVREKLKNTPAEGHEDALANGGADFKRFFNWYRNEEDRENQNIRRDRSYTDPKLDAVRNAIETFTGFSDLHIDRKTPLRMMVKKNDVELSVNQLSNGEKCLLALVGDLARRLALVNPLSPNPLLGEAIVLIDEIDLHLHPKWQRNALKNFSDTFPNCQFIVSTHSPQIIGEISPENVLLVRDGRVLGHPSSARGLSSDEVLELIMEGDARNPAIKHQIEKIEACLDDDDVEKARQQLIELEQQIGNTPDVMRLRSKNVTERRSKRSLILSPAKISIFIIWQHATPPSLHKTYCDYGAQYKGDYDPCDHPLFLSPLLTSVESHFKFFADGRIEAVTERGKETIRALQLDHNTLRHFRKKTITGAIYPRGIKGGYISASEARRLAAEVLQPTPDGRLREFCIAIHHAALMHASKLEQRTKRKSTQRRD